MATAFRATVVGAYTDSPILFFDSGETVVVGAETFVRLAYGTLVPMDARWSSTRQGAAALVVGELERRRGEYQTLIDRVMDGTI